MNYFDPEQAAERYSKGRPYFHGNTIDRIKAHLKLTNKLDKALDIACGTGLSTKALSDIAVHVYGTDTSAEMLSRAASRDIIHYTMAQAEHQPFEDRQFDVITVCSGVHWFNIDAFLIEANRLLKANSWLVIYDNFFISEMQDVDAFAKWYPDVYLKKFPAPGRNDSYNWSTANLAAKHFALDKEEDFKNSISYTLEELVLYFTTQSNITAAVNSGHITYSKAEQWLRKELGRFYSAGNARTLNFGNWMKYLRKTT